MLNSNTLTSVGTTPTSSDAIARPADRLGAVIIGIGMDHQRRAKQHPKETWEFCVELRPEFGLGAAARVEKLEITWPSGIHQALTGVNADQILMVREK